MSPVWLDVIMLLFGNLTDSDLSVVKFLMCGINDVGRYIPVLPVSTTAG